MPTIIIKNGANSFFCSLSLKIIIAINNEKIISPLLKIDALTALESFSPKKYTISAETSATPIAIRKNQFFESIFLVGWSIFLQLV